MTDKLPDGNVQYKHGEQCQHCHLKRVCNECDLEASVAYWSGRCRLAMGALNEICLKQGVGSYLIAHRARRAVGELPKEQP
jgi:hypothetical protein